MDTQPIRTPFVLLYLTAWCLWFFIAPCTAASCDSVPHQKLGWGEKSQGWSLDSEECAEPDRHYFIQVGDNDNGDTESTLEASLTFPVKGFRIDPGTLKLYCDNSTIADLGLNVFNIYITVRDACPTHALQFQMNIEFTDIPAVTNHHDPRISPTTVNVFRDLYETGETDVATLSCTDDDNDDITTINIVKQAPFSIAPTPFASTFTLMLTESLTSMPSQMTLTLEAVDNGTPPRTGTTLLTLNIREDTTTTTTTTITTTTTTTTTPSTTTDIPTNKTVSSSCDSVPHAILGWNGKPPGWSLKSAGECAEEDKHFYIQVGDKDSVDTEDTLVASLTFPVAGFYIRPGTLKLYCDNSTITEKSLREYNIDITVRDACPNHTLQFQMKVEFTDIPVDIGTAPNLYDPRITPTTVDVLRDLYETDGETRVATLSCMDDDNDEIIAINIINLAQFSIVPTSFASTFTLMLTGSLASMPSQMTLTLEAVDNGTPPRTGTTLLTLNILEDAITGTTDTTTKDPPVIPVGWVAWLAGSTGVLLVILFVLAIVVVYARRRNKWCFTSQTDAKDMRPTQESGSGYIVRSPPEDHVVPYVIAPFNEYDRIGRTHSEISGSVSNGRASDYTEGGVASGGTDMSGVPGGHPFSNGNSVHQPQYPKEHTYDNNGHIRPSMWGRY